MSWRCPPPPKNPVRVALVGSELDVITGLMRRLSDRADLEVVGSFGSMTTALAGLRSLDPDVVLVERDLVDGEGSEVCTRLRRTGHGAACLVLSAVPLPPASSTAVDAVVLKTLTGDSLEREILRLGRLPPGSGQRRTEGTVDE